MRLTRKLVKGNLVGKQFDNLTVIRRVVNRVAKETGREYVSWECSCTCGKVIIVTTRALRKGKKSCGCLSVSCWFKKCKSTLNVVINAQITSYKGRARERGHAWELSWEETKLLFTGNCCYCGQPPRGGRHWYHSEYRVNEQDKIYVNGIDRQDNTKGYTVENAVSCCAMCNRAKLNLPQMDFEQWLNDLVRFRNDKTCTY